MEFQPYAWEAREFLRKKMVGKEVCFTVEYKVPGSGREYGCIFIGKGMAPEIRQPNSYVSYPMTMSKNCVIPTMH